MEHQTHPTVLSARLDPFYERMAQEILGGEDTRLCQQILSLMALVHRPIGLCELVTLVEDPQSFVEVAEDLPELVEMCGSFLAVKEDQTVAFIHQSSQDFVRSRFESKLIPASEFTMHTVIATRALEGMSRRLHKDMYMLLDPAIHVNEIHAPFNDPLKPIHYGCVCWADHIHSALAVVNSNHHPDMSLLCDDGPVHQFMKSHFIHWLESLSLKGVTYVGISSLMRLFRLIKDKLGESDLVITRRRVEDV